MADDWENAKDKNDDENDNESGSESDEGEEVEARPARVQETTSKSMLLSTLIGHSSLLYLPTVPSIPSNSVPFRSLQSLRWSLAAR